MPTVTQESPSHEDKLICEPAREIHRWIAERSGLVWVEDFVGIARVVDGKIVAAFGFDHHQDSSCCLHTACDRGGYSRELLRRVFWVAFRQWGYKCLISIAQNGNLKSNNVAARLGFQEFAILPGAHPSGSLRFGVMYSDQCRWLEPMGSYK